MNKKQFTYKGVEFELQVDLSKSTKVKSFLTDKTEQHEVVIFEKNGPFSHKETSTTEGLADCVNRLECKAANEIEERLSVKKPESVLNELGFSKTEE